MGRSQETYGKKENDKNRLKKKKEKEQKREERKNSNNKGKSLDEMFAYVDENGNLTSTPPDPNKKKVINVENIQIGIGRQEAIIQDIVRKGTVAFFNETKAYGFIKDTQTQESVFVHLNGLIDKIKENDKVTFEVEMGQKGPNAIKVKLDK